jgi:hypothetical protein
MWIKLNAFALRLRAHFPFATTLQYISRTWTSSVIHLMLRAATARSFLRFLA